MRTASSPLLLTAVFLIALATPPPSAYDALAQDKAVTVTGCVERDAAATVPVYKLIVAENGASVIYQLSAPGNGAVAAAVGKTVQVTGVPSVERRAGRDVRMLAVKSIEVVAERCGGDSLRRSLSR